VKDSPCLDSYSYQRKCIAFMSNALAVLTLFTSFVDIDVTTRGLMHATTTAAQALRRLTHPS
jgi:hypothetical protein